MTSVFRNGRVFVASSSPNDGDNFTECMIIKNDRIAYVGPEIEIPEGATVIDLNNRVVVPGFVDGHVPESESH